MRAFHLHPFAAHAVYLCLFIGNSLFLQCMQEHFASDTCKSDTDNMRRTRLIIEPMDRRIFNPGNSFDEMLFQLTHLLHFFIQILVNCLRCKRQSCNTRNVFRTGADILLLFSSKQNWFDLHFAVNIQHSRSFRSMNLMSTY